MSGPIVAFKLFVIVLSVSDTGSISRNSMVTDIPTYEQCQQLVAQMSGETKASVEGHSVTTNVKSICVPLEANVGYDRATPPPGAMPPQLGQLLDGFVRRMQ